jgi:hypothetical protein
MLALLERAAPCGLLRFRTGWAVNRLGPFYSWGTVEGLLKRGLLAFGARRLNKQSALITPAGWRLLLRLSAPEAVEADLPPGLADVLAKLGEKIHARRLEPAS